MTRSEIHDMARSKGVIFLFVNIGYQRPGLPSPDDDGWNNDRGIGDEHYLMRVLRKGTLARP